MRLCRREKLKRGLCVQAKYSVLLSPSRPAVYGKLRGGACVCEAGEEKKVLLLDIGSMQHGEQRSEVRQALEGSGSLLEVNSSHFMSFSESR